MEMGPIRKMAGDRMTRRRMTLQGIESLLIRTRIPHPHPDGRHPHHLRRLRLVISLRRRVVTGMRIAVRTTTISEPMLIWLVVEGTRRAT